MIRIIPYADADGATNMAADEVMVRIAADHGQASLRFYGWNEATVSLGYFQSADARLTDRLIAPLPFVRRPSGGATLVHHYELTYALALPPGSIWHAAEPWMPRMHRIAIKALISLGVTHGLELSGDATLRHGDVLCFQQFTPGDLLCKGRKVGGSAQKKHHRALMQHGSVLLRQSEFTPALPGIQELSGIVLANQNLRDALLHEFIRDTGWHVEESDWSPPERHTVNELAETKYRSKDWNERR